MPRAFDLGPTPLPWCSRDFHDGCAGRKGEATCTCTCHGFHVDLEHGQHDLELNDRITLRCFAAFLRHAATYGSIGSMVPVHEPWHAWLTGKGPAPDPDSEVGPKPEPLVESCGGNYG